MTDTLEIIFSVREFSDALRGVVEGTFARIKIRGEICGLKRHSSGHTYFDLKESFGGKDYILNCTLWKWTACPVKFEEGLEVIITGKATTYGGRSSYQLTVESAEIAGVGALFKIIEERKKKLMAEGIFDAARKKSIPKFPRTIGVITSPTGAVIRDIIHRISDRYPCRIILYPCAVQGDGAEKSIISGIEFLGARSDVDTIIVARGGGSLQDLMPFNDEGVVRSAAACRVPLISAVGHETDTTLIDFAADLRAPTPTAAAELATPNRKELLAFLSVASGRLTTSLLRVSENFRLRLGGAFGRLKNPMQVVADFGQRLDEKTARLQTVVATRMNRLGDRVEFIKKMLASYSFKNVLDRGYGIVWSGDEVVDSVKDFKGVLSLELKDGKVEITKVLRRNSDSEPSLF